VEALWVGQRAHLRHLLTLHPDWTCQQVADAVNCSTSMVSKWRRRFAQADPKDVMVLFSHSRARHHPPPGLDLEVISRIVDIRLAPPDHLQRVPGPWAILYYLHRDPELLASGKRLPRSTSTIWRILRQCGMLPEAQPSQHAPLPLRAPLEEVQMDFKDVSTVPADPEGKQRHVVEVCNFVDAGTSILLDAQVHPDFHAETAFEAVINFLARYGVPPALIFDRDPRWVGSPTGGDFPSALCRFLLCVGVQPIILPPRHPELNAYVERYHRSYKEECLLVHRPATLEEVRRVTEEYASHYNDKRPHQGRACQNRPPRVAFPVLPTLPALPSLVDPDLWLEEQHGRAFSRRVKVDGRILVDGTAYYVKQALAGQMVTLLVNAHEHLFEVVLGQQVIKRLPIKGLVGRRLPLAAYIERMQEQARSEERQRRLRAHLRRQA
jgi:transposase InsO family protein